LTLLRPEILVCPEAISDAGAFLAKAAIQAIREPDAKPMQELEVPPAV
jgi:LacI family transcriptional regulator